MADNEKIEVVLPEGRLINNSLMKLDEYEDDNGKKGTPRYNVEIVFPKAETKEGGGLDALLNAIMDGASNKWKEPDGGWALNTDGRDYDLHTGLIDGDVYAAKRERNGKPGDAYKGMWILRAHTIFDRSGQRGGTNGATVYDEELNDVLPVDASKIWNGMRVQAKVSLNFYEKQDDAGTCSNSFYLTAIQLRGGDPEKDRLASVGNHKDAFQPVGRKTGGGGGSGEGGGRRSRKG